MLRKSLCALLFLCSFNAFGGDLPKCTDNLDTHLGTLYDCGMGLKFKIPIFSECEFTKKDIPTLITYLNKNPRIKALEIVNRNLDDDDITIIATAQSIEWLNVSYNKITAKGAAAIAKMPALRYLSLRYNRISNEGAIALSNESNLTYLDAVYNNIDTLGAKALAKIKNLAVLYLDNNFNINDEAAGDFAANSNLKKLYLADNNIGDVGATILAKQDHITDLGLSYNHVGDTGAIALAQNQTLRWLYLKNNKIGEKGVSALQANTNFIELILMDNHPDMKRIFKLGNTTENYCNK